MSDASNAHEERKEVESFLPGQLFHPREKQLHDISLTILDPMKIWIPNADSFFIRKNNREKKGHGPYCVSLQLLETDSMMQ